MRNGDLLSLGREYCETIHCLSRNIDVVKLPFSLRRTALFFFSSLFVPAVADPVYACD